MNYARTFQSPRSLLTRGFLAALLAVGACGDDEGSDGQGSGTADGTGTTSSGGTADETATGSTSTADATGSGEAEGSESSGTVEPPGVACINDQFVNGPSPGPDYSMFGVTLGSHCQGTNHQDIVDVERVVFLGDSVTVGTRPTSTNDFYRSLLADELAAHFGIQAPDNQWKTANLLTGMAGAQQSGDFASCAEWGARNDDLMAQLEQCFAPEDFDRRTLVVMTMGGNDAASIAQDAIAGADAGTLFMELETMVEHHRSALEWLLGDPERFPNGVFVVNANVYEFTDYTGDVLSCPAAGVAGFDANPPQPDLLVASLTLINEHYAELAAEYGTDLLFMFEEFCGHGFHADDPNNVCYRGPGNENWFDLTCIHPTPSGHAALTEMFMNVITE